MLAAAEMGQTYSLVNKFTEKRELEFKFQVNLPNQLIYQSSNKIEPKAAKFKHEK